GVEDIAGCGRSRHKENIFLYGNICQPQNYLEWGASECKGDAWQSAETSDKVFKRKWTDLCCYGSGCAVIRYRLPAKPYGVVGQAVGLLVLFARDVGDAELKGSRELAAHPVQRVEPGTAAGVLAGHLLDDQFRVRINAERGGIEVERALQGLKKSSVFGHVVIVMADPLGDPDQLAIGFFNQNANA